MKAKIKSYESVDISDLENFVPNDPTNFAFLLELTVGPDGEEGEEIFDIQVCTPYWLLSIMSKTDAIPGHGFLIVLEYDFEHIFRKVKQLIENCTGKNWHEVARKVARIGYWEFEDYIDEPH